MAYLELVLLLIAIGGAGLGVVAVARSLRERGARVPPPAARTVE